MVFKEFQFEITPILLSEELGQDTPHAVRAKQITVHGIKELREFCDRFPSELTQINIELAINEAQAAQAAQATLATPIELNEDSECPT